MYSTQTLPLPQLTTTEPAKPRTFLAVWLRRLVRLVQLMAVLSWAAVEITCALLFTPSVVTRTAVRARWLQRTCRRVLRCLRVRADFAGQPPAEGLLVCNHLSYLDIIVLGAHQPMTFVSKSEVRDWPGIGWLTDCAGTIFIDRELRSDVARAGAALTGKVALGTVVCLFPEGTSSDGAEVLPFRPSLLQPAVERNWTVTPAHLGYALGDGDVENEVCYWRDMTFAPHLLNLLGKRVIHARVRYGNSRKPEGDRKQFAAQLRGEVRDLAGHTSRAGVAPDV